MPTYLYIYISEINIYIFSVIFSTFKPYPLFQIVVSCISIYLHISAYLYIYIPTYQYIYITIILCINLSIYQSIYRSIYLYIYISIFLYIHIDLHLHICICLYISFFRNISAVEGFPSK